MIQVSILEQVREVMWVVLERFEFWPDLFIGWFYRIWDWVFEQLFEWSIVNSSVVRVLIIALSAVLVLLFAHLAYTVAREFASLWTMGGRSHEHALVLVFLVEIRTGWKDVVRLVRDVVGRGDLYRALWITHCVLFAVFDKSNAIEFRKWKTNGDYVCECRGWSHAETFFVLLTSAYETVVYVHREFDRDKASELLDRVEALAKEVGL